MCTEDITNRSAHIPDLTRKSELNVCLSKTATFEAERQAFYDNEQHLKSRIQSLTHTRKLPPVPRSPTVPDMSETDTDERRRGTRPTSISFPEKDPDDEPAEMTALRLELSTLSTSYASLQNTLVLLQTQLVDLKRVNNQLQEENESYNILLREKTLSGQYDLFKQVNGDGSNTGDEEVRRTTWAISKVLTASRTVANSARSTNTLMKKSYMLTLELITATLCNILTTRNPLGETGPRAESAVVKVVAITAALHILPHLVESLSLGCPSLARGST
jgi:hypothetical protein